MRGGRQVEREVQEVMDVNDMGLHHLEQLGEPLGDQWRAVGIRE